MHLTAGQKFWICVVLVAIPAMAHAVNLTRFIDQSGHEVVRWGMAISATIPYVFLMLVFLAQCDRNQRKAAKRGLSAFPLAACCGACTAWVAIILHSINLIEGASLPQQLSSTMGIAVMLMPFYYLPYLVLPYLIGAFAGGAWSHWRARRAVDVSDAVSAQPRIS